MKIEVLMQVYYKGELVIVDGVYKVIGRESKYFIITANREVKLVKESELVFIQPKVG